MADEPRDYRLARRAYEAFWSEQPQIWFDQLSHAYQMRWVETARAVVKDMRQWRPSSDKLAECEAILAAAPRKESGKRINYKGLSESRIREIKTALHYVNLQRKKSDT